MKPLHPRAHFDDPALDDTHAASEADFTPRRCPARRTYLICSGDYEHERVSGINLDLEAVIKEQLEDIGAEEAWYAERGGEPVAEDFAIWGEGNRLLAVIRPLGKGKAAVFRIKEGGPA